MEIAQDSSVLKQHLVRRQFERAATCETERRSKPRQSDPHFRPRPFGHVVYFVGVAAMGTLVGTAVFQDDRFAGSAQGDGQEGFQVLGQIQGGAESGLVDRGDDAAAQPAFDGAQQHGLSAMPVSQSQRRQMRLSPMITMFLRSEIGDRK